MTLHSPSPPRIGDPVVRHEDLRLVTGRGQFSDDLDLPGQAFAAMVRTPHAHAIIRGIDTREALRADGVLGVYTGEDLIKDRLQPIPHRPQLPSAPDVQLKACEGTELVKTPHMLLPADKVRFTGEAVAMVVADTREQAIAAAELVQVSYEPLSAVVHAARAEADGVENIWPQAARNVCMESETGDRTATDRAFESAAHITTFETRIQRVTGVPMEPRAAVGDYDPATGVYTLHAGSGGVMRQKRELSKVLNIDEDKVRVVAHDIGGNFGTRNGFYPEFGLVAWAAKKLGRPVKWTAVRSESFASDYQGRDLTVRAELALDEDGRFLALRSTNTSNIGGHTVTFVPLTKGAGLMTSVYDIPAAHVRARAVLTNTPPTNSYRSAGRPEVIYVMERLIDLAAREHGFDRVDLRRRNMIASDGSFFSNPLTLTYDGGLYENCMDRALELADWDGFGKRRKKAAKKGLLRGIGVANYIEITTGALRERTEITVRPDGVVEYVVGTLSSGQGHETSFKQLLTEWLHVPFDSIHLVQGDSDRMVFGGGTQSGRSMRLISIVAGVATDRIIERARNIAARVYGIEDGAVRFEDGHILGQGQGQTFDLFEIARIAETSNALPDDLRGPLRGICDETVDTAGYPYGAHVCEVEVDPETGQYEIAGYFAVDDVGTCVNPLIVHGQTHGAIAQGLGQAMCEECVYDEGDGQLLAGSFMDYAMPRADTMPSYTAEISEFPSPTNRVGVRSGGEGGTTPALGVLVNALTDALKDYGVTHIEMPATPCRVWKAIQAAKISAKTPAANRDKSGKGKRKPKDKKTTKKGKKT